MLIQVWEGKDILRLSTGAWFRQRHQSPVYRVDADGVVNLQPAEFGYVNNLEAEVTPSLSENTVVILHLTDRIEKGIRVMLRTHDEA